MIVKTLAENTAVSGEFQAEHGLSLYIETRKHKILFDMGASPLFVENAKKLNVDLTEVDLAIISHGHYDHGGGLKAFLNINTKAKIYVHRQAFAKHYAFENGKKKDIGLEATILPNNRFIFVGDQMNIDEQLCLFSNVTDSGQGLSANKQLFKAVGTDFIADDFAHEQNLLIKEDNKLLLVAGCAHKGIVNIVDHVNMNLTKHINGEQASLTHVIGGFHLYSISTRLAEDPLLVNRIGLRLQETKAQYYTCHCTGIESYNVLRRVMGNQIQYLATGSQITI
ncbi:MAG: MBL fold metallo-hydrolase [Peptococcaceae bacterium]|nr:MBL fold metallo-hydrolase [Peptococcaceae bacterium]